MKKTTLFKIAMFFLSFPMFSQTTVYVSNSGNDSNSGSEISPFKTITKAFEFLDSNSGGICLLKDGVYHDQVILNNLNNITLRPQNEGMVTIDGTLSISNTWSQNETYSHIWETTISEHIWQLFIDDKQQVMARWPNAQFYDDSIFDGNNWASIKDTSTDGSIYDSGKLLNSGLTDLTGGIIVGNFNSYKTSDMFITNHNGDLLNYSTDNSVYGYGPSNISTDHSKYFLEGKLELLDTENEWFYDINTNKLYVYGDPSGKSVKGKNSTYAFNIEDSDNITIEGLDFFGTTFSFNNSNNITVRDCKFAFPSHSKRMIRDLSSPSATTFKARKNTNSNNLIERCLFEYTEGEALILGKGINTKVLDNFFHHIDYSVTTGRGLGVTISSGGEQLEFSRNVIHTTGASATLHLGDKAIISYNDVSNTGLCQNDGAVVQITRAGVPECDVHHNWIHDTKKTALRFDAPGGQAYLAGHNGYLHHNVIWNLKGGGMMVKGDYQKIHHNTVFDCGTEAENKADIILLVEDTVIRDADGDPILDADGKTQKEMIGNENTLAYNNLADRISGDRRLQAPIHAQLQKNIYSQTNDDLGVRAFLRDPDNRDFRPKLGLTTIINEGVIIPEIDFIPSYDGDLPEIGAYNENDNWAAGVTWDPDFFPWGQIDTGSVIIEDVVFNEGENVEVPIQLSHVARSNVKIYFEIEDVTTNSSDYVSKSHEITFNLNEKKKSLFIPTNDDELIEGTEKFKLKVTKVENAIFSEYSDIGEITLLDNDLGAEELNGFVRNPSFDMTPDFVNWTFDGLDGVDSYEITNDYATLDSGKKCLKINSTTTNNFSKTSIESDVYRVQGDNSNTITVTVSYYAKTNDGEINGKVFVKESYDSSNTALGSKKHTYTNEWAKYTFTHSFNAQEFYDLNVSFDLGAVNGYLLLDKIETSISGGVNLNGATYPIYATLKSANTNESNGFIETEVELSELSTADTILTFSFSDVDTDNNDFNHSDITLTVPAGEKTTTILIPLNEDNLIEGDEKFETVISSYTNSDDVINYSSTPVEFTIIDNDFNLGDFELSINQDSWAYDISVEIINTENGEVVYSHNFESGDNNSLTKNYFSLPDGNYQLVITDAFGDGIKDGVINLIDTRDSNTIIEDENFVGTNLYSSDSKVIPFNVSYESLSLDKTDSELGFRLYPNPTKGLLNLSSISKMNEINIYDIQGKRVYSFKGSDYKQQIDISDLQNGMYILETRFDNHKISTKRIIKN